MIMKKLNNRQNQVKSLDFSNHQNFLFKQGVKPSPQQMKATTTGQVSQINAKGPQKQENNQFAKKSTVVINPSKHTRVSSGVNLNQRQTKHNFLSSPVKNQNQNFPLSINNAKSGKDQSNKEYKIGLHKKATSMMQSKIPSGNSSIDSRQYNLDFGKNFMHPSGVRGADSQKQSMLVSAQTSFNEYMTNNYPQDLNENAQSNLDNLLAGEKIGSLLTHTQQQQLINYQNMLADPQHLRTIEQLTNPQTPARYQMGRTIDNTGKKETSVMQGQKSYDQRTPIASNVMNSTQSQRVSINGGVASYDFQQNHTCPAAQSKVQAYRSHTNCFKNNSYIAMKHQQSKYVKGTTNTHSFEKGKKTIQPHHQRTLSDKNNQCLQNPVSMYLGSNYQGQSNQQTNRNVRGSVKIAKDKGPFLQNNFMQVENPPMHIQNFGMSMGSNLGNTQANFNNAKTTLGSSRQSIYSQPALEDRDFILSHYNNQGSKQEKYSDLKTIYNGMLKDQFQHTKQALQVTQQQFGGPSRKVVSSSKLNNGYTQSFRASNYVPLSSTLISKASDTKEKKATPKIRINKSGKSSTKQQSHNTSSQGIKSSQNTSQGGTAGLHTDKIRKKKIEKMFGTGQLPHENNIQVNPSGTNTNSFRQGQPLKHSQVMHKRSISDGNQFVSLSGRVNHPVIGGQENPNQKQNNYMVQMNNSNMRGNENEKTQMKPNSLQKSQKRLPQQYVQAQRDLNRQDLLLHSERQSYRQSNEQMKKQQSQGISSPQKQFKPQHHKKKLSYAGNDYQKMAQVPEVNSAQLQSQQCSKSKSQPKQQMTIEDQSQKSPMQSDITPKEKLPQKPPNLPLTKSQAEKLEKYRQPCSFQPQLKVVDERIETQDSGISDPNLSPRTKMTHKIIKKIRLAFQKTEQPPATSSDFYKIGKVMGKGAFGKVNLAIHRLSDKFVAIKSINKQFLSEEASKRKVMQEFNILKRTRHQNIVRLYESFETAQHIVFVMEVCGAGDLLTYVRRRRKLKEDVSKHIFRQIIEGLRYCHSKNVLHRDIKLDNILLTSEGDVKICDFGVSKLVKDGEIMTEQCGTPAYIAPEVFENKGYQGYASDIWSAGVVLYAMLYGSVPFKASNMTELQKQIIKCQTSFKDEISTEAISLLKGILERDPSKRLTYSQILGDPWMASCTEKAIIFTDQEKQRVVSDFAYYNFKKDKEGGDQVEHTDPFAEQMLNSTQNSMIKNLSTKSVVLAPFNSTRTHIDDDIHLRKSIQDLMIDKKNLKFAAKVKEIDRQYEQNNNAELDNGVYHQDDEEVKEEPKEEKKRNSIETSFDNEDLPLNEYYDQEQLLQNEIEFGQKKKKQSEWQKIEQMIDRQQTQEEDDERDQQTRHATLTNAQMLIIDEKKLSEVEKTGYQKQYVVQSLNNDELNYATAFYYLLCTHKEY